MPILGAAFSIGRSALAAYQAAIAVTGQNIANVGNADYTRQTGHLTALPGGTTLNGLSPGGGVGIDALLRNIDEAVEARLRAALAARSGSSTRYQTLNRIESSYGELSDTDLSTQLNDLFASFSTLQTDPQENTARDQVIANADAVVRTLQRQRRSLLEQVNDLNDSTTAALRDVNRTAAEIADLNEQIVAASARGRGSDSALRDRRDALLRGLADLVDIQTREQGNGAVTVYLGSEPLVEFSRARMLEVRTTLEDGVQRAEIRYADSGGNVIIRDGQLAAMGAARDLDLVGQLTQIDQLARGLIYEVNRVHSTGRGLSGYTALTGSYTVNHPDAALNSTAAGLDFPVQNGTFVVQVRNAANDRTTSSLIQIDLDNLNRDDTTLYSLAQALSAIPGLSASVTADNRLQINTAAGMEVSFGDDTSGVLAALGIGTFFEGTDAATMAINAAVRGNPQLIASSANGAAGDGTNAGRLAAVGTTASSLLGNLSVQDFHASITNRLAVATAAAQVDYEAADTVYSSLLAQRESTSGVSLDEEAINLTMFERSFQGASRYVSVLDTLSTELLAIVE